MKISLRLPAGVVVCLCLLFPSCRSRQTVRDSLSYYHFDTSVVNVSPSGLLTLRAWGSGPDIANAVRNAQKNAVADVIFKGVKGGASYMTQPLVTEVNARERYAEYFDRFFADGGEYARFVHETSGKDGSRSRAKSSGRENYGVTLDIDRNALRQQLIDDGILNR